MSRASVLVAELAAVVGTSEGRAEVTDGVGEIDGDIGDGGEDTSSGDGVDGREDIIS